MQLSRQDQFPSPSVKSTALEPSPEEARFQINLRLRLDEVVEVEAVKLRAAARRQPTRRELRKLACRMYDARRLRDRLLDQDLFGEPAWDMLLALYCLPSRGEMLSVSGLSLAAGTPITTGLRWQKLLTDEGLIERGPDELDARRQFIRLTENGRSLFERFLTRLYFCNLPAPTKTSVE